MAGSIIVRWRRSCASPNGGQQGFSLAETLFAMLLLAMSISALLNYHRALTLGFSQQQQQQQEAWRAAAQRLSGWEIPGWQSDLSRRSGPGGCELETANVVGPGQRRVALSLLRCK
ncbi:prepilin-type N-terminal cleavage/methylation domain-containing protein [Pantoea sp.]|uniref:prepilin-type N-terminal cleavage/methylation domain-containing protein n=1 Tax=Pantoea sp. TaxID=69393 RepID=UPI0028995C58|nr:prepilin-type N-terminal cleavage/methylation domain-containing protein [Pantoea sp.]